MQEFFSWKEKVRTFYTLVNSAVLAVAKLQAICIMFANMMVTVKLIVEKKNLTAKRINDIIMRELRETFCRARMNVKLHESDSTVSVTYIRGHNHPIGVEYPVYQPTPTSVLNSIKTKQSLGVPVDNIYRELREGIINRNSR